MDTYETFGGTDEDFLAVHDRIDSVAARASMYLPEGQQFLVDWYEHERGPWRVLIVEDSADGNGRVVEKVGQYATSADVVAFLTFYGLVTIISQA